MKLEMERGFTKKLARKIERYTFEVGVLDDGPHYEGIEGVDDQPPAQKSYAGGPARKQTRVPSGLTIGEVLVKNMERMNINILLRPFEEKSALLVRFTNEFLKSALAAKSMKRVENLLQSVVRTPILKGEYGANSSIAADHKGFNRFLIDTAQMFKSLKAKAKRV